jgi:outer membrane protein OmpA-like peptidoglycan-associated protein
LARLETFATEIAAEAVGPVTIVGHTDSLGTDEHNRCDVSSVWPT